MNFGKSALSAVLSAAMLYTGAPVFAMQAPDNHPDMKDHKNAQESKKGKSRNAAKDGPGASHASSSPAPHAFVNHSNWKKGFRMNHNDWDRGARVDYRAHNLDAPPQGEEWREVDGNYVLASIATGLIRTTIVVSTHPDHPANAR